MTTTTFGEATTTYNGQKLKTVTVFVRGEERPLALSDVHRAAKDLESAKAILVNLGVYAGAEQGPVLAQALQDKCRTAIEWKDPKTIKRDPPKFRVVDLRSRGL